MSGKKNEEASINDAFGCKCTGIVYEWSWKKFNNTNLKKLI